MTGEIHDAEHRLTQLAESAAMGEDVILTAHGKPLARLISIAEEKPKRKLGFFDGMYEVPDDIDTMFEKEIEEMFYGSAAE